MDTNYTRIMRETNVESRVETRLKHGTTRKSLVSVVKRDV